MHRKNIFPKINSKNYKFSVFFLPEFLYRQCRNWNRNSLFLFRTPPKGFIEDSWNAWVTRGHSIIVREWWMAGMSAHSQ